MSRLTIKCRSVSEATEPAAFGKAYHDFVNRCWTDHKPNYSVNAINFLLDCAHIANGTNVKGLPQQGFKLTRAGNVDLVGDCLHLQYSKDDGRKGVDVWLNPHTQKALVDLYGFNSDDPYASTHKEFSSRNYTADDFCEFIESLPNYKGESKTAESRKLTIRLHEAKTFEVADEQVEHGEECHLFIEDDPNYQVSFRSDNGHVYTFYVRANDSQDAIDTAHSEFGSHRLSVKGEGDLKDIPQEAEPVEVGINYAPKVNVAVDPYDGSRIRVVRVPEYYLPAMVNGDTSGMEEQDIKDYEEFEQSLIDDGLNPSSIFPVCGPDGEYWDGDSWGDVLCSTVIDK